MYKERLVNNNNLKNQNTLKSKITSLDDEIANTLLLSGESYIKKNEALAKNNQKQRQALTDAIGAKEALLKCPVCYRTASPPINKCTMEHLICSKCFPRVNGKCPSCRTVFNPSNLVFRLAEEISRELVSMKMTIQGHQLGEGILSSDNEVSSPSLSDEDLDDDYSGPPSPLNVWHHELEDMNQEEENGIEDQDEGSEQEEMLADAY